MPDQDRRGIEVLLALFAIGVFGATGVLLLLGDGWGWALPMAASLFVLWTTRRAWVPFYRLNEEAAGRRERNG